MLAINYYVTRGKHCLHYYYGGYTLLLMYSCPNLIITPRVAALRWSVLRKSLVSLYSICLRCSCTFFGWYIWYIYWYGTISRYHNFYKFVIAKITVCLLISYLYFHAGEVDRLPKLHLCCFLLIPCEFLFCILFILVTTRSKWGDNRWAVNLP